MTPFPFFSTEGLSVLEVRRKNLLHLLLLLRFKELWGVATDDEDSDEVREEDEFKELEESEGLAIPPWRLDPGPRSLLNPTAC